MLDLLDLKIPFKPSYIQYGQKENWGFLIPTFIDMALPFNQSLDKYGALNRETHNGYDDPLHSNISSLYFKVIIQTTSQNPFPHIHIAGSPAKLLQGHNVYGSDNIELSWLLMLRLLKSKNPNLYQMLDILDSRVVALDINYSSRFGSEQEGRQLIQYLSNVSDGQVKATRSMNNQTVYWNKSDKNQAGQLAERKAYLKGEELPNYIKKIKKLNLPKEVINRIIKINTKEELLAFAKYLLRWEVKIKSKYLKQKFNNNLITDLIQIQKFYKNENKNLMHELFNYGFSKIFKAIGDKKMILHDYQTIRDKLKQKGYKLSLINPAIATYRQLTAFGWLDTRDSMTSTTFYRHIRLLVQVISKAQLQNLNSKYDGNTIPLLNFVNINFSQQFPDDYVESTLESLGLKDFADEVYNQSWEHYEMAVNEGCA